MLAKFQPKHKYLDKRNCEISYFLSSHLRSVEVIQRKLSGVMRVKQERESKVGS